MTIASNDNRRSYLGNGATKIFAFPPPFTASSDLVVQLKLADGTISTKALGTDYAVSSPPYTAGGNVTMVAAPATGTTLIIYRDVPLTQSVDLEDGGPLPADTMNGALDRFTMQLQRQSERLDIGLPDLSGYATSAATSATQAAASATNAAGSASNAAASAATALAGIATIGNSANAAANSATASANSATAAAGSATSANSNATAAAASATAASGSANASANSATSSATSATAASGSASNASTSATNSANSATTASTASTNAGTSATAAATSAGNASNSATASTTSATVAAGSATAASGYANNAAASANSAATSATAAIVHMMIWSHAWATSTAYIASDVVQDGGSSWICILAHTSGPTTEPGIGASYTTYWELVASKGLNGSGTGDVIGPVSSVAGHIAKFADTSGDVLLDGGPLATVAATGAYGDLTGLPTLGTAAALNTGTGAGNIPLLDGGGKIVSAVLPSYVDDVLEFANLAALPGTGETGKIYVTLDTNFEYRWSGSVYIRLVASPGSTDNVPEGSTNLYFLASRVLAVALTGLSTATNAAITTADTVLSALGKLQKQISDHFANSMISGLVSLASSVVAGDLIVGSGAGTVTRIAKGADGQIIKMNAGVQQYQDDPIVGTYVLNGGGSVLTTGIKGSGLRFPQAFTITEVSIVAQPSGAIVVEVWNDSYANFPPTSGDKISASAPITITATGNKAKDATLTGWTTAIPADSVMFFNINSVTTITDATITIKGKKA